jgi:trehalose-6-phosphatase
MSNYRTYDRVTFGEVLTWAVAVLATLAILIGFIAGVIFGFQAFARYQRTANAHNAAGVARISAENEQHVNELRIAAQQQKVKIAQQEAQIRYEQAKGVREAQDEISSTLTPLYVQFEMIEALKAIAKDGKNSSVVFIPSGTAGIPLVSGAQGPAVGLPAK